MNAVKETSVVDVYCLYQSIPGSSSQPALLYQSSAAVTAHSPGKRIALLWSDGMKNGGGVSGKVAVETENKSTLIKPRQRQIPRERTRWSV